MQLLDITLQLHPDIPSWPGDPPFLRQPCSYATNGAPDSCGLSSLSFSSHAGTHVDAPVHIFPGGTSVASLDLALLCGPCRVIDATAFGLAIKESHLRTCALDGVDRLLLKTANGELLSKPFSENYAHLTLCAARFLRHNTSVRLVGIDYLSIEAFSSPGLPVHHALLDGPSPILIVEALDLRAVEPGDYELFCLPLPIRDGDGAPARAVLVAGKGSTNATP